MCTLPLSVTPQFPFWEICCFEAKTLDWTGTSESVLSTWIVGFPQGQCSQQWGDVSLFRWARS